MIATGEIGKVQGKKTAFEQPAIFEFFCHLAIERRESTHDVLRLSISGGLLFSRRAWRVLKGLFSKTEIHGPTHSNSRMLMREPSTGSAKSLTFGFIPACLAQACDLIATTTKNPTPRRVPLLSIGLVAIPIVCCETKCYVCLAQLAELAAFYKRVDVGGPEVIPDIRPALSFATIIKFVWQS